MRDWHQVLPCVVLAGLFATACTDPVARKPTIIAVLVEADEVVRDETVRVEVEVDSELEEGSGWKSVERRSFRVDPDPIAWPIAFKFEAARTVAESYGLVATAYDGHGAVVARAHAIRSGARVIDDRLRVHFERSCYRRTTLCPEGNTCHGGDCVSARDELPPSAADAGAAGGDGAAPGEPSEALAQEGGGCGRPGARACAGPDSQTPLTCESGVWRAAAACGEAERCAVGPGDGAGTCKPIARECMNQTLNVPFCEAGTMKVCTDLVSSEIRTCDEHRRCAPGPTGAECKCESGYVAEGARCVPGTDCGDNRGGCDPLTECSMVGGVRTCSACPPGYVGTGKDGCEPLLEALTLDAGELDPPFDPAVRAYHVRVPIAAPRVALIARAPGQTRVSFDAVAVPNGQPWLSPLLTVGSRSLELQLTTEAGESTSYALTIERTGDQRTYIKPSNPDRNDWFGIALAMSGDRFVTGSFLEDSAATVVGGDQGNGLTDSGAAYVFARSGEQWTQEAYLKASDAQQNDVFGASVAIDRDTIAVGAVRASPGGSSDGARSGAAYVFTREGNTWSQQQRLAASTPRNGDYFGSAVAVEGDTLAVGVSHGGVSEAARGGAVHVFQREGTTWTERQIVTPSTMGGQFGTSVVLEGERMIVGAPAEDGEAGAAYVFERRSGSWVEVQRLRPESIGTGSKFGFSVTLFGDRLAVGAPHHPRAGSIAAVPPGEVYVFEREGGRWEQTALLRAPISDETDYFGSSVSLSARALAVGSNGDASAASGVNSDARNNDAPWAGAAYVFANLGRTRWESSVYVKPDNTLFDSGFGYSLVLGDDVLIVGAPNESAIATGIDGRRSSNSGSPRSGAVYVFR